MGSGEGWVKLWTSGLVLGGLREGLVSFSSASLGLACTSSCASGEFRGGLREGEDEMMGLLLNKGRITGIAGELWLSFVGRCMLFLVCEWGAQGWDLGICG